MRKAAIRYQPKANSLNPTVRPSPSRPRFAPFAPFARFVWPLLLLLFLPITAHAHVGSKDVFQQITAGPYKLFVTVRMPTVIPGIATIEVRTASPVDSIRITPMPLTGEASKHPPTPDAMQHASNSGDPNFYTGSLWMMASGSWQVRFEVSGPAGDATASVPVAAMPLAVLRMDRSLGLILGTLGIVLALGFAGIVGAAVRESRVPPGVAPTAGRSRRALFATGGALVFIGAAILLANHWWKVEAADYAANLYHPFELHPSLAGNALTLAITRDPRDETPADSRRAAQKPIAIQDFLLDHGKVMHLYAIRQPQMDAVFHLHPAPAPDNTLRLTLPSMPAGDYKLYADIVLPGGFPETLTATLSVPPGASVAALAADDASAIPPPLSSGLLGASYKLPDGYTMVWDHPATLAASTATLFRFRLLDPSGSPAQDVQPYLGMAGHAAFVKTDGTVFAHTHPEGSAAMPAVMLANAESPGPPSASESDSGTMPGMNMPTGKLPPVVEFPYGFPTAGVYRIFIQMKHGNTVETGVFDAQVR